MYFVIKAQPYNRRLQYEQDPNSDMQAHERLHDFFNNPRKNERYRKEIRKE